MLGYIKLLSAINKSSGTRPLIVRSKKEYLPILNYLSVTGNILSFNTVGEYLVIKGRGIGKIEYKNLFLKSVSVKSLKRFQYREGGIAAYMMYTDRGFCLGSSAISQHISGKLIVKLL